MEENTPLTKKERKKLAKLQKEEEREKLARSDKLKNFFSRIIVLAVTGLVILGIVKVFSAGNIPSQKTELLEVKSTDWVKGNTESKVVMIEYSDFQCPACAFYYNIINTLMREYGSKMKFVYRHFPLKQIHKNAALAAWTTEAAGKQGKFWQMHDLLFENQEVWSEQESPKGIFADYAKSLSLDVAQFEADMNSQDIKDKVENSLKTGEQLGVNATPTFYLNGKKLGNVGNYEQLKKLIEEEIGK